ncbi:hypothetical protein T492DRAFT_870032 [Pavlovales sp. CCMP2436]|nr:hypothetical protein T492DRAFT_870032 [Pavlovales sp. CCMP2436]
MLNVGGWDDDDSGTWKAAAAATMGAERKVCARREPRKVSSTRANEDATAAPARLKGGVARSGSTPCKHQGHLQPSDSTSGRDAAGILVPAA